MRSRWYFCETWEARFAMRHQVALDVESTGELPSVLMVPVRGRFALLPHVQGDVVARLDGLTAFSLSGPLEPLALDIAHRCSRAFRGGLAAPPFAVSALTCSA
jgi:hypothetical protein